MGARTWAGAAAVAAALACAGPAATAPPPVMTLEEVLQSQRRLAAARFAPEGGRILLSLERQDRPTLGAPWRLANTESYIWRAKDGALTRILDADGAFKPTLCEPWSPSGRYVAGLVLQNGRRRAAVWDTRAGRAVVFPVETASMCLPWAGDRLVVMIPAADVPAGGSSRRAAADLLRKRWEAAWRGEAPQITVHSADPAVPGSAPEPGRLALADPASGRVVILAEGDFHSPTPSPDGRWIAAARLGPADPAALSRRTGRLGALVLFDLSGAAPRMVRSAPDLDVDYAALAWDATSRRLLLAGRRAGDAAPGLWALVDGGAPTAIPLPPGVRLGSGLSAAFSTVRPIGWLGAVPAFIGARRGVSLPAASDTARDYGDAGREALGLYAATPDGVRLLTPFARQSVASFAIDPDGAALVVADGGLWRVEPEGPPRRLTAEEAQVVALAQERPTWGAPYAPRLARPQVQVLARDDGGRLRLLTVSTHTGQSLAEADGRSVVAVSPTGDAALRQEDDGWSTTLTLAAAPHREVMALNPAWRDRPVGKVEAFEYAAGGRTLTGWIVHPPDAQEGPAPAIVWVYGGAAHPLRPPADALPGRSVTPVFSGQLWAGLGYAVIYPSTALPTAAEGDVAGALASQAVAAIDAAAARGWVDPERVGLAGHSFGAFSVAAILSRRSDRFRAAVAMSGPYDFAAGWGSRAALDRLTDPGGWTGAEETRGRVEDGQIGLKAPPFEAPEAYVRASPFYAASRIRTPLLLTVGDLDHGSTSLQQAERFYAALRRTGNPAVLVRYWGQDHVQDEPWAVRDQWRRFTEWFGRRLRPLSWEAAAARPAGPAPGPANGAPRPPS